MSRVLLIGLDGAEPSLIQPWMDGGHLPNLALLRDRGCYLPCASTTPPATFPAWTTCVTGVNPGRHGIFDFIEMKPNEYALCFINATHRRAPALWNILSDAGKRVCVLGVPATYPPEPVNGILVSGFDSPVATRIDDSFVYPRSEYPAVRGWAFADFQESNIGPGWHDRALPRLLEGIATKERIALDLLKREPWDFFMLVFGESDTVAHHFWLFHDPKSARHRPGHETAIRQVYERLDAAVGSLIAAVHQDTFIAVVSDHGFGGAGTGVVHLNNWLAERGYLAFTPARESLAKRLALSLVPESARGTLFRRFTAAAARAESVSRFAGIDWTRTRAWSDELNYFPSIRINLAGREPDGRVPARDYDRFSAELCRDLESAPFIAKAWRRDELYTGPCIERAPDIVLDLALEDGYSHSLLRSRGGPSFRRIAAHEHLGGKERGMNGNHRPTGILLLSEKSRATRVSLLDIAPTIVAALNVPAPPMDGISLLETRPVREGRTIAECPSLTGRVSAAYTPEQEAAIESRLRDLGYFE